MTSINGFCNEEFELEKEFCHQKKKQTHKHVSVIKVHGSKDGRYITENTLNTKFETFLAGSIMAYKYNYCAQTRKIWGLVAYLTTNQQIWIHLMYVDY